MCDCKRFNKKKKSNFECATHEMTCKDCGVGKLYLIGNEPWKVVKNN